MTEDHHRTDYLRQLGEEIKNNREILTTDFVRMEEQFQGDAKWMNFLDLVHERTGEEINQHIIHNTEDFIMPYPAATHPGDASWKVTRHTREIQPMALQAQEDLEQARESANFADHMTSADLDALEEIPYALSRMLGTTRAARDWFRDGETDVSDRQQAKVNDTEFWVGPGSDAYVSSLGIQASYFRRAAEDLDTIEEGCLAVSNATIELLIAISNIYIEKIDEWSRIVGDCIAIASGPSSWATYASRLLREVTKPMKKAAEDFQSKVEELGRMEVAQSLIEKCENIPLDDWPSPTANALLRN